MIRICVERAFCSVVVDLNIFILIALTDYTSSALFRISRSPRNIEAMGGYNQLHPQLPFQRSIYAADPNHRKLFALVCPSLFQCEFLKNKRIFKVFRTFCIFAEWVVRILFFVKINACYPFSLHHSNRLPISVCHSTSHLVFNALVFKKTPYN